MDNMSFFKQGVSGVPKITSLEPFETTQKRPKQCQEYRVRIFVKDGTKAELARSAFEKYKAKNSGLFNLEESVVKVSTSRNGAQRKFNNSANHTVQAKTKPVLYGSGGKGGANSNMSAPQKRMRHD